MARARTTAKKTGVAAKPTSPVIRYQRLHGDQRTSEDHRQQGRRDRDRILYSSALQRLAGVTQVVGPLEGPVYHNRLTHTLKVAQIARSLAEKLRIESPELADSLGGIDLDVIEAAALAHDLGHPPFGHTAEKELNRLARERGAAPEGFEGNAQSFRIVTRLAAHRRDYKGLNLTRATLNAILKYPRLRDLTNSDPEYQEKFGAYRSDIESFDYARELGPANHQSLEAAILDHADAIAYSVHDVDDFFRAGLIPFENLRPGSTELGEFFQEWKGGKNSSPEEIKMHEPAIMRMLRILPFYRRYTGEFEERARLRHTMSDLIHKFIAAVSLKERDSAGKVLQIDSDQLVCMRVLQGLVWHYVIINPRLATQQHGQRRIVETLFDIYTTAIKKGDRQLIPPIFRREFDDLEASDLIKGAIEPARAQLAVDIVASLTDAQAGSLYRTLTGVSHGSIHELPP